MIPKILVSYIWGSWICPSAQFVDFDELFPQVLHQALLNEMPEVLGSSPTIFSCMITAFAARKGSKDIRETWPIRAAWFLFQRKREIKPQFQRVTWYKLSFCKQPIGNEQNNLLIFWLSSELHQGIITYGHIWTHSNPVLSLTVNISLNICYVTYIANTNSAHIYWLNQHMLRTYY